jgi:hypothetical protein
MLPLHINSQLSFDVPSFDAVSELSPALINNLLREDIKARVRTNSRCTGDFRRLLTPHASSMVVFWLVFPFDGENTAFIAAAQGVLYNSISEPSSDRLTSAAVHHVPAAVEEIYERQAGAHHSV